MLLLLVADIHQPCSLLGHETFCKLLGSNDHVIACEKCTCKQSSSPYFISSALFSITIFQWVILEIRVCVCLVVCCMVYFLRTPSRCYSVNSTPAVHSAVQQTWTFMSCRDQLVTTWQARIYIAQTAQTVHPNNRFFNELFEFIPFSNW